MDAKSRQRLTDQELAIMNIVWERGQATVRDVYEVMLRERKIAYTTVMTTMKIMQQKGHLKKRSEGRAYVYSPTQPKSQVIRNLVTDFVGRVFQGSAEPLLLHLVQNQDLSAQDLEKARRAAQAAREEDR